MSGIINLEKEKKKKEKDTKEMKIYKSTDIEELDKNGSGEILVGIPKKEKKLKRELSEKEKDKKPKVHSEITTDPIFIPERKDPKDITFDPFESNGSPLSEKKSLDLTKSPTVGDISKDKKFDKKPMERRNSDIGTPKDKSKEKPLPPTTIPHAISKEEIKLSESFEEQVFEETMNDSKDGGDSEESENSLRERYERLKKEEDKLKDKKEQYRNQKSQIRKEKEALIKTMKKRKERI